MRKCSKQKVSMFLVIAVLLFGGINIVWYINFDMYDKYKEGYEKFRTAYNKSNEEVDFTVKKPQYLSMQGNFSIGDKSQTVTIIIWPGIFFKEPFEYGVIIRDEISNRQYMIYVDQDMKYLDKKNATIPPEEMREEKNVLKSKAKQIEVLYKMAKEEWNL